MSREIEIDTIALEKSIENAQTRLDSINSNIEKMYEAIRLLDTMWDGPANEIFKTQFLKDQVDFQDICKIIQQIINDMNYAKSTYNICDSQITEIINSIKSL